MGYNDLAQMLDVLSQSKMEQGSVFWLGLEVINNLAEGVDVYLYLFNG